MTETTRLPRWLIGTLALGVVFVCVTNEGASTVWRSSPKVKGSHIVKGKSDRRQNFRKGATAGLRRTVYRITKNKADSLPVKNGVVGKVLEEETVRGEDMKHWVRMLQSEGSLLRNEGSLLGNEGSMTSTERPESTETNDTSERSESGGSSGGSNGGTNRVGNPGVTYYNWYYRNHNQQSGWSWASRFSTLAGRTSRNFGWNSGSTTSRASDASVRTGAGSNPKANHWWWPSYNKGSNRNLEREYPQVFTMSRGSDNKGEKSVKKKQLQIGNVSGASGVGVQNQPSLGRSLDLFVAGFPKCGTTTLLYTLKKHPETAIGDREECDIAGAQTSDATAFSKLNGALEKLDVPDSSIKTAVKCPTGLKNFHGLERLQHHSPDVRFVIGIRHPVKFFQSFYNYRITELYNSGSAGQSIPSVEDLVGSREWKGVSTDNAKYEMFLRQLGKADVTASDLSEMSKKVNMAVVPSSSKVFIYSLEQLEDEDEERAQRFRTDLQDFLQLQAPIDPFERKNKNHYVGDKAFSETIDICDARYDDIRSILMLQAAKTQEWIRNSFLASTDVFVGNQEHFEEILKSWRHDPCDETSIRDVSAKART